jgi:sugar phosphate isomerase/epimerase
MQSFRLGLSSGSFHPDIKRVELAFRFAKEFDLDGVEIICDAHRDAHRAERINDLIRTYGVPVLSLHAPFAYRDIPGWRRGGIENIIQTVHLAENIGANNVIIHLPEKLRFYRLQLLGRPFWLPLVSRQGRRVMYWIKGGGLFRKQAKSTVQICVENLPRMAKHLSPGWFFWWSSLKDWPAVHEHLALDTTHWATQGVDPQTAYTTARSKIRHIHLSNYRCGRQHQLPHRGQLDLQGFLSQVAKDGFDGLIILELNGHSLGAGALRQNLSESIAFCRRALRRG